MTSSVEHNEKSQTQAANAETVAIGPQLMRLARTTSTPSKFWKETLSLIGTQTQAIYGNVKLSLPAGSIEEYWHTGPTSPNFWAETVKQLQHQSMANHRPIAQLYGSKTTSSRVAIIASPVYGKEANQIGALAFVIPVIDEQQIQAQLLHLNSTAEIASSCAISVGANKTTQSNNQLSGQVFNGVAQSSKYADLYAFAFAVTNNLCSRINCDQVAIGILKSGRIQLLAISGLDDLQHKSRGAESIHQAMAECYDMATPVTVCTHTSPNSDENQLNYKLHLKWCAKANGHAAMSIPLLDGDQIVGIISTLRYKDMPFSNDDVQQAQELLAPIGTSLRLFCKADRPLAKHAVESCSEKAQHLFSQKGRGRLIALTLFLGAALWFCFGSLQYNVVAPAVVSAAQRQHITTPFDGTLVESNVVAGDAVQQGQIICRFDTTLLGEQHNRLTHQIASMQTEYEAAIADNDTQAATVTSARIKVHEAERNAIQTRINMATIKAPYSGIITSGDLRQRIGQVLKTGDPLFVISPNQGWKVDIKVPESSIDEVVNSGIGYFVSNARPDMDIPLEIIRISPAAEKWEGKNIFVVEAAMQSEAPYVRSGVEGIASIDANQRPVWWITLHRLIDWARMTL